MTVHADRLGRGLGIRGVDFAPRTLGERGANESLPLSPPPLLRGGPSRAVATVSLS